MGIKKAIKFKKTWLAIAATATAIGGYVAGDVSVNELIQKVLLLIGVF
jgi:hypothetical protein